MSSPFMPKLFTVLREGYTRKQFWQDLTAGVIVGIIALPLAIAFAIASGVKPEQGLYTAIIAGFLISALSGSRVQIGGPTGAFIVIVYGIVQQYGYDGLMIATFIAGIMILAMGFARLGVVIKYIPYPVIVGFTTGIALIIFSGQMRDFFGLQMANVPAEFIDKWTVYAEHFATINPHALGIGLLSLAIVVWWPKLTHRVPGSLIAILAATALVHVFNLPVETIGSRFGEVPSHLPKPHVPELSWSLFTKMFSPALTIALLAAIESLLSAVVADGMLGTRHRSNMELIAQGVANIVSPIFGGIPATGAIARTAANIKNGGRTPIAGLVHALTLLLIMLFFAKWAALIPMATLAAILVVVAYNMSEWHLFIKIFRSPRSDVAVLLITFLLTVLIDLTVAIEVGVVLAAFLFMRRMSMVTQVGFITEASKRARKKMKSSCGAIPMRFRNVKCRTASRCSRSTARSSSARRINSKMRCSAWQNHPKYSFCACATRRPLMPAACARWKTFAIERAKKARTSFSPAFTGSLCTPCAARPCWKRSARKISFAILIAH